MNTLRTLTCHCGAVVLEIRGLKNLDQSYRCDCSYSARRGAIICAVPKEDVRIVQGGDMLSLYQWGTHTAKHYFCSACGIYTHHQRKVNPMEFGLNIAALNGVNPRDLGDINWPATSQR